MNLLDYRKDKYTSIGNDGIIEKIFDTIGVSEGSFIEFGAWDGIHGCNCRRLIEQGWNGVFIEPVLYRYLQLKWNYRNAKRVRKIRSRIDPSGSRSLDNIVSEKGQEYDFISIDIDGLDIEVFEGLQNTLPKVFCIEGGQMLEPFSNRVSKDIASKNIQQSLSVINEIANQKGYKVVCSYQDTFLVKDEYYHLFPVDEDLRKLYYSGLKSSHRRLPWIQYMLSRAGLRNRIIDQILMDSGFDAYGFKNRKDWARDIGDSIGGIIDEVYLRLDI